MDDTGFTREIREQPAALRTVTGYYRSGAGAEALSAAVEAIGRAGKLVITGMGTSWHAALAVRRELAGAVPACELWDAGELLHFGRGALRKNTVLVAVSQSGESAETREVVTSASGTCTVIGIVNTPDSTIGTTADIVLPLHAGSEASISNKTYTNTLAVLFMAAGALSGSPAADTADTLDAAATMMADNMEDSAMLAADAAGFFRGMSPLHIIARGRDLVTAKQWALILKEGAGISGQGTSAGMFRHGPIELGGPGLALACVVSEEARPELTLSLAEELAGMGSHVLVVGDTAYDTGLRHITIPSTAPGHFPFLCAPFIELYVHETAKHRGRTAGIFTHAVKVTDRE